MPVQPKQMPFFQHFAELRKRLTVIVVVIFILSFVFYSKDIYVFLLNIFLGPVKEYLPNGTLTVLGPFEQMTFRFKVSFAAALIASMPITLYEIFAFITPALKPKEKKWVFPTVIAAVLLFALGVVFAYFVIMGPAFEWLSSQGAGIINSMAAADQYFSGISMLMVGFGIGFELPLVVFYLIGLSILKYDAVRGGWRYAYVAIVIVAAVATPDWSPWTMGGLAVSLIALYEISLAAARIVFASKIKQQRIDEKEYEEYYADDSSSEDSSDKTAKQKIIERAAKEQQSRS